MNTITPASGETTEEELLNSFDVSSHPNVTSGEMTERELLEELVSHFEVGGVKDGKIQKDEFLNYYSNVSATIDDDRQFENMIREAWNINDDEELDPNHPFMPKPIKAVGHSFNPMASSKNAATAIFGDGPINNNGSGSSGGVDDLGMTKAQLRNRKYLAARNASNVLISGGVPDVPSGATRPQRRAQMSSLSGGILKKDLVSDVHDQFGRLKISAAPVSLEQITSSKNSGRAIYQSGMDVLFDRLRKELANHGAHGIIGLSRKFKIIDDDGNKQLDPREFKKAINELGLDLTDEDISGMFVHMDKDGSGSISFEEFLQALKGPLSSSRKRLMNMAFDTLDLDGNGIVEPSEVLSKFDASQHPEVIAGRKTPQDVMQAFLDTFDVGGEVDGKVTRQEFENYYHNMSASIDNEDYFELMIRNAWHISGGEGWAANTANKRVLVVRPDGSHSLEEVPQPAGDKAAMLARLKKQNMSFGSPGVTQSLFGDGEYGSKSSPIQAPPSRFNNKSLTSQITFG
jgi:Ca2+-binding EF-hand superfamily protein